ncbi:hypothetical protein BKA80DRAFT_281305 [Phyllosticta citrichinensis]
MLGLGHELEEVLEAMPAVRPGLSDVKSVDLNVSLIGRLLSSIEALRGRRLSSSAASLISIHTWSLSPSTMKSARLLLSRRARSRRERVPSRPSSASSSCSKVKHFLAPTLMLTNQRVLRFSCLSIWGMFLDLSPLWQKWKTRMEALGTTVFLWKTKTKTN